MAGYQGSSTRHHPHEALSSMIEAERREVMTGVKGKVVSYDKATQRAKIKPAYKQTFAGKVMEAPELIDVPVRHPRAGKLIMHTNLKAGDEVDIHFPSRGMDAYHEGGKPIDGAPARMTGWSDVEASPSATAKGRAAKNMPDSPFYMGTEDGKSGMKINDDGKHEIVKDGDSIYKVIGDFLAMFRDHTNNMLPLDQKVAVAGLISRVNAMKAD